MLAYPVRHKRSFMMESGESIWNVRIGACQVHLRLASSPASPEPSFRNIHEQSIYDNLLNCMAHLLHLTGLDLGSVRVRGEIDCRRVLHL